MQHKLSVHSLAYLLLYVSLSFAGSSWANTSQFKIGGMSGHPLNPLGVQVLSEAYAQLDIAIELAEYSSPRSIQLANRGLLDGELARIDGITNMYPNLLKVDWPITELDTVAVTNKANFTIDDDLDLSNYTVGILRGAVIKEYVQFDPTTTLEVTHSEQLIRMLQTQRLDLAIMPRSVALVLIRQDPALNIVGPSVGVHPIYHYVNRRHRALIPELRQILQTMAETGRINALEQQFLQKQK